MGPVRTALEVVELEHVVSRLAKSEECEERLSALYQGIDYMRYGLLKYQDESISFQIMWEEKLGHVSFRCILLF